MTDCHSDCCEFNSHLEAILFETPRYQFCKKKSFVLFRKNSNGIFLRNNFFLSPRSFPLFFVCLAAHCNQGTSPVTLQTNYHLLCLSLKCSINHNCFLCTGLKKKKMFEHLIVILSFAQIIHEEEKDV